MNILALDYGTKNIGLAKWNSNVSVILPIGVVSTIEELVSLVKEQNIDKIVIGLPLNLDGGQDNPNVKRIKEFGKSLYERCQKEVEYFDERFSSQQADRMEAGVSRDERSAIVILQSYLDNKNLS